MDTQNSTIKMWLSDLIMNLRFFTRIPIPGMLELDDPEAPPDFSRIPRLFPLVGTIIAIPLLIILPLTTLTALPNLILASLAILYLCMVCGALHEDGLADCADGFFGGNTPQVRLEIMKDSRLGSFGAIALIISLLIRIILVSEILNLTSGMACAFTLLATATASRAAALWVWVLLPTARPEGLASKFGSPDSNIVLQANLIALLVSSPLIFAFSLIHFMLAGILCFGAVLLFCKFAKFKIGGQTGDVIGAAQQLGEIGFLIGLVLIG